MAAEADDIRNVVYDQTFNSVTSNLSIGGGAQVVEHLQLLARQHLVLSVFQEVESFMKLMENYLDLVTLHLDLYTM